MATIEIYKRGYEFHYDAKFNMMTVPYGARKDEIVDYIRAVIGRGAFANYDFVIVRRIGDRWRGQTATSRFTL